MRILISSNYMYFIVWFVSGQTGQTHFHDEGHSMMQLLSVSKFQDWYFVMPPTLKKLMGHIAFGASVCGCVGHTFCTYCNF